MLSKFRSFSRLHLLAALFLGLVFSMLMASFSPETASAAGSNTEPTYPVSGKVTAKGSDTFTLQFGNSTRQYTFRVNSSTKYTQPGNSKPGFADMKVGMEISATVKYPGANSTYYLAVSVTLPAATPPPPTCYTSGWLYGAVASKTSTSISVVWQNGEKSKVPFLVSPNTLITKNGKAVSFNDVKPGQRIEFKVRTCGANQGYYVLEMRLI